VAKKAGKTELAAALALYLLIGDEEPSPLIACAAASEEQADLVFGAAKTMSKMSPTLSMITEVYDKEILVPSIPGAKLRRVAAAAGTNDGPSYSAVICDELHEWTGPKGEAVWNVLTNSTGARRQPLVIQITTAGVAMSDTVCERQYLHGRQVTTGEADDPTYLFRWWEAPADAAIDDPEAWQAANPSYGVTVQPEFFADQLRRKPEGVFRRYFLNQWSSSSELWLPRWGDCLHPDDAIPEAATIAVGVDVGLTSDSTAVAWAHKLADSGRIIVRCRVWSARPETASHVFVPGGRVQLEPVEEFIRSLAKRYTLAELAYDPRFFERSAQMLSDEGLTVAPLNQGSQPMADAYQAFYAAVSAGTLSHDGDDVLTAHVRATAAEQTDRGWKVRKLKSSMRIDATVAAVMAHYRAEFAAQTPAFFLW
jgi:phage terminase large subunit-like protein